MKRALTTAAFVAAGLVAGFLLWVVSVYVLVAVGFAFYAVTAAAFLALAVWLVAAALLYLRIGRRNPETRKHIVPFLAGMLILVVYFCVGSSPHLVMPR
jgi:hypothetical protein